MLNFPTDRIHYNVLKRGKRTPHGNVEIKLSLCLITQTPSYENVEGRGGIAPPFLISAPNGSEFEASIPCRFSSARRSPILIGLEAASRICKILKLQSLHLQEFFAVSILHNALVININYVIFNGESVYFIIYMAELFN
jgi:hypothetical protein